MACFTCVTLSLPTEDAQLLDRLVEQKGATQSAVIREALKLLETHERELAVTKSFLTLDR